MELKMKDFACHFFMINFFDIKIKTIVGNEYDRC